ncbi:MAG: hypothetical protein LBO82_03985 [Synergistaceae bacterium]|jgi:hypothetical protein|nr:hypothetical protein [Synergistaceae bacterium]
MIEEHTPALRSGWFLRTVLFLCLLIAVYFILVSTASFWPKGRLDAHLKEAFSLLNQEGRSWMPFGTMPPLMGDGEALMLNITGTLDPGEPVRSAIRMNVSYAPEDTAGLYGGLHDLEKFVEGKATMQQSYARYWHGYTVVLRPLLSVMTFPDVRKLSFFCLMTLFSAVMILLVHRADWVAALSFAVAMTWGSLPLPAFSMAYMPGFAIALILMCAILYWNIKDEESLVRLFLLAGSLTAFLDFLITPVITFTLPLLAWLLPDLERRPHWDWRRVKSILLLGVVWSAGYLLTWAAKWGLADIVLGEGLVREAVNQILLRTGGAEGMTFFDRMFAVIKNVYVMIPFSVAVSGGKRMSEVIAAVIYQIRDAENLTWFDKLTLMMKEASTLLPSSIFLGLIVTALVLTIYGDQQRETAANRCAWIFFSGIFVLDSLLLVFCRGQSLHYPLFFRVSRSTLVCLAVSDIAAHHEETQRGVKRLQ